MRKWFLASTFDIRHSIFCGSLIAFLALLPAGAAASIAPVAVFPLQELSKGRNEVNVPFTLSLAERLAASGNEISSHETVISFMANNRIRTVGHLESFHISRVRDELGVAFVLLGTVSQLKEKPIPSMGITLNLVRTSDGRTMWSYVGHLSAADARKVLGIGEPTSVAELQPLLLDDIIANWPWEVIGEMQQSATISIDSVTMQPIHVRPGGEVHASVRLRNEWPAGRSPRGFFQADNQIHAATLAPDSNIFEATWVAGEKDGRFPVNLILEWPLYGRSETALLGAYVVDGAPPLLDLELKGAQLHDDTWVFRNEIILLPRLLVRKPLARWRLAFFDETGLLVGADEEPGNIPEHFIWRGRGKEGQLEDGIYKVTVEAWDHAGNKASVSRRLELSRRSPEVALAVARTSDEILVDLKHDGKVPLAFWRMEMWSREGRIIKEIEGRELPAQVGIDLPSGEDEEISGFVLVQDVLGNKVRKEVQDLFLLAGKREVKEVKKEKTTDPSESWVDQF